MAKLKAKQSARDAERNKEVMITQGELDDMKAKIASLEAQIVQLRAATANAAASTPKVEAVRVIAVGETREQVADFLRRHPNEYELIADTVSTPHTVARTKVTSIQRDGSNSIDQKNGLNIAANQNEGVKQRETTTEEGDKTEIPVLMRKSYQPVKVGSHDEYNGVSHSQVADYQKQWVGVERLTINVVNNQVAAIDRSTSGLSSPVGVTSDSSGGGSAVIGGRGSRSVFR